MLTKIRVRVLIILDSFDYSSTLAPGAWDRDEGREDSDLPLCDVAFLAVEQSFEVMVLWTMNTVPADRCSNAFTAAVLEERGRNIHPG
jgi:hypothetical protein